MLFLKKKIILPPPPPRPPLPLLDSEFGLATEKKGTAAGWGEKNLRAAESASREPGEQKQTVAPPWGAPRRSRLRPLRLPPRVTPPSPDLSQPPPVFLFLDRVCELRGAPGGFGFQFAGFSEGLVLGRSNLEAAQCRAALVRSDSLMVSCSV
jgi:hypothetical protein